MGKIDVSMLNPPFDELYNYYGIDAHKIKEWKWYDKVAVGTEPYRKGYWRRLDAKYGQHEKRIIEVGSEEFLREGEIYDDVEKLIKHRSKVIGRRSMNGIEYIIRNSWYLFIEIFTKVVARELLLGSSVYTHSAYMNFKLVNQRKKDINYKSKWRYVPGYNLKYPMLLVSFNKKVVEKVSEEKGVFKEFLYVFSFLRSKLRQWVDAKLTDGELYLHDNYARIRYYRKEKAIPFNGYTSSEYMDVKRKELEKRIKKIVE